MTSSFSLTTSHKFITAKSEWKKAFLARKTLSEASEAPGGCAAASTLTHTNAARLRR